jgi:hypothetical protein
MADPGRQRRHASATAFRYASLDPTGLITVDKPPLAFWIQAAGAKLFGFSSQSLLGPSALAGAVSVAVLGRTVTRLFGAWAGHAVAGLYNRVASRYNSTGPPVFAHFGQRLVELATLAPGEGVLNVGAGRGAILFPATERVTVHGHVIILLSLTACR